MEPDELIPLPIPTNATVKGPLLEYCEERVVLKYDYEQVFGPVKWVTVRFNETLVLEVRKHSCCDAESITRARHVYRYRDSHWLRTLITKRNEALGEHWLKYERERGLADRFSHYCVYFDDAACVNIVAASCEVGEVVEETGN